MGGEFSGSWNLDRSEGDDSLLELLLVMKLLLTSQREPLASSTPMVSAVLGLPLDGDREFKRLRLNCFCLGCGLVILEQQNAEGKAGAKQ